MPDYIILRDVRLTGTLAARCPVVTVTASTSLSSIFSSIKAAAGKPKRIGTLFILCHGYAGMNRKARLCVDAGGEGLQLGSESVLHANGGCWTEIAGIC